MILTTRPDPAALLIDLRPAEEFAVSRLPGAVHLDLWGLSLIDTSEAPLRAFTWMIGHLFSLRGVRPDRPVVLYNASKGGLRRSPRCARSSRSQNMVHL